MIFRLALFGLIASSLVGVIYVITEPMIVESKKDARNKRLYSLAEPLLSEGKIGNPINKVLANDAPVSLINPLPVTPINDGKLQIGAVIPFRALDGYSGTIELLLALDIDRRIVGVRAIDYKETRGLGDQIDVRHGAATSACCTKSESGMLPTTTAMSIWSRARSGMKLEILISSRSSG